MGNSQTRSIRITEADLVRLQRVIAARRAVRGHDRAHLDALEDELDQAEVVDVDELPSDVVTMRSQVRVRDVASGEENVYTLSFPADADLDRGFLSVLAPIGTALLGYRQGDVIEWPVPGGIRRLEVAEVLYQPEAAAVGSARRGPLSTSQREG